MYLISWTVQHNRTIIENCKTIVAYICACFCLKTTFFLNLTCLKIKLI